jgi:hypothetical protein
MSGHTPEAVRLLADLDADLAAASEASGRDLEWSTAETEAREAIADTVDRRRVVKGLWDEHCDDPKLAVKLSVELRQLDAAVVRLLKEISTEPPQPESLTTIKARRAVNTRWDRERQRNG